MNDLNTTVTLDDKTCGTCQHWKRRMAFLAGCGFCSCLHLTHRTDVYSLGSTGELANLETAIDFYCKYYKPQPEGPFFAMIDWAAQADETVCSLLTTDRSDRRTLIRLPLCVVETQRLADWLNEREKYERP